MPDFTIQTYYCCEPFWRWTRDNQIWEASMDGPNPEKEPDCHWDQFIDGSDPVTLKNGEKRCPNCGAPVTAQQWAV
jgi:hypothetical protein